MRDPASGRASFAICEFNDEPEAGDCRWFGGPDGRLVADRSDRGDRP